MYFQVTETRFTTVPPLPLGARVWSVEDWQAGGREPAGIQSQQNELDAHELQFEGAPKHSSPPPRDLGCRHRDQ